MPRDYTTESLSHDPVHGYIPFISRHGLPAGEVAESEIIDHPWVQRLRFIHQLQTAHYVFPAAEHTRFPHVMGVMHLASLAMEYWYDSLCEACANVPSRGYVESLVRMAGLLHDVGHGPFGHFFDDQYLDQFEITHEDIGAHIIQVELGDLLRGIRRNPRGELKPLEQLEPAQIAWLIRRPRGGAQDEGHPDWLHKLRALFSGIYTVDNMDFVLRDAYMSGYNTKAFDLSRLLHYSFFTPEGLTIHIRGLSSLINFIETRANLFRTIYFHRTVRAMDVALEDIFADSMKHLFPGNPLEHLPEYQRFSEMSLLVDVQRWCLSHDAELRELGNAWEALLTRNYRWVMSCQRTINFHVGSSEQTSILSEPLVVEARLRKKLPRELRDVTLRLDVARHYHRPRGPRPASGQNFLLDPGQGRPQPLDDNQIFRELPTSFLILRVYSDTHRHDASINAALDAVLGDAGGDTKTNM